MSSRHLHGAESGDATNVVAAEIDEHHVLGALLLVGAGAPPASAASSSGVAPRGRVPAIGRTVTRPPATRTSSSGELPTSSTPSSTRWYMYGDGLSARSARYSVAGRKVERHLDAPREQHLKGVAGEDVLLDALDVGSMYCSRA